MTKSTTDQHQLEAARSVAAKLGAFHDSLTQDEREVLDAALRSIAASGDETTEDAAGYFTPIWLPAIVSKIVEMVQEEAGSTLSPSQRAAQRAQRR